MKVSVPVEKSYTSAFIRQYGDFEHSGKISHEHFVHELSYRFTWREKPLKRTEVTTRPRVPWTVQPAPTLVVPTSNQRLRFQIIFLHFECCMRKGFSVFPVFEELAAIKIVIEDKCCFEVKLVPVYDDGHMLRA